MQQFAANQAIVEVNGNTTRQCFNELIRQFPEAKELLFNDDGSLNILVLVNDNIISLEDLDKPISEKDLIWLINIEFGG